MLLWHLLKPLGVITIGKVMEPVIIDLLRSHRSRLTEEEAQMFSCFWLVQRMYIVRDFLNTQDWVTLEESLWRIGMD